MAERDTLEAMLLVDTTIEPFGGGVWTGRGLLLAALAAVFALVALAGCTESLPPDEVLARARTAMDAAGSYSFEAHVFRRQGRTDTTGEWAAPGRYHAVSPGAELIIIGTEQYARPLQEDWDVWRRTAIPKEEPRPHEPLQVPPLTGLRFGTSSGGGNYRVEGYAEMISQGSSQTLATAYALEIDKGSFLITRIINWLVPFDPETESPGCVTDTEVFDGCPRSVNRLFDHGVPVIIEPPTPSILATLVRDITPGEHGANIGELFAVNDRLVFPVQEDRHGHEPWTSDGTEEGTKVLLDITPGPAGSVRNLLRVLGNVLLFTACDCIYGTQLWRSDSTAEGTFMVKDILPDAPGPDPPDMWRALGVLEGELFFQAGDGEHGSELWRTDGTPQGTELVKDIWPGLVGSTPRSLRWHSRPWFEPVMGGYLYFTAEQAETGYELWKTDGTPTGTVLVKDIWPSRRGSIPSFLGIMEGVLYFRAEDEEHGRELWRSDGTSEGTWLVKDFVPGSGNGFPDEMIGIGGTLFLAAVDGVHGRELWRSDGTEEGTVLVKDISPGPEGSVTTDVTALNGVVLFEANEGIHGQELWRSDGTEEGTWLIKDIRPGPGAHALPNAFSKAGGELVFIAIGDEAGHHQRWRTDGTPDGTVIVRKGIGDGFQSIQGRSVTAGGIEFFVVSEWVQGLELWKVTQ